MGAEFLDRLTPIRRFGNDHHIGLITHDGDDAWEEKRVIIHRHNSDWVGTDCHFLCPFPKSEESSIPAVTRGVGNGGGNDQFDLRTRTHFAPKRKIPAQEFGAFAHATQPPVSQRPLLAWAS